MIPPFDEWFRARHDTSFEEMVFMMPISEALILLTRELRDYTTQMVRKALEAKP